ncbi:MAG: diacylglycerol kinase (ATP) [Paracoccaceae bacterium]
MNKTRNAFQTKLKGFSHFRHAAIWSIRGLRSAYAGESAFRHQLLLVTVLLPLGLWLGDTKVERALLAVSPLIILVVELLNTAVESVVDRIGPEYHALSGRAKDIGSAAVFLTICAVGLLWAIILFPIL